LPEIKIIKDDEEQAAEGSWREESLINDDYNARLETEELELTAGRRRTKKDVEVEEIKVVETSEEQALYLIIEG
jgi:hypothetical protein